MILAASVPKPRLYPTLVCVLLARIVPALAERIIPHRMGERRNVTATNTTYRSRLGATRRWNGRRLFARTRWSVDRNGAGRRHEP